MPLNLNDLIKKAKDKGIVSQSSKNFPLLKPWQQESVLFDPKNQRETSQMPGGNKATTKRQQTDNKVATKRQQTDNKVATKRQQKSTKNFSTSESGNKVATKPTTLSATKWQQSGNKVATKHSFSSLVGLQRMLLIFIYEECKVARSKTTKSLSLEHISITLKKPCGSIKTTLQRLEEKNFLERAEFKNGRGGWSKYALSDQIFQEMLKYETDNKLATNWQQIDNKVATEPTTKLATTPPVVSSSYININKTTTTADLEIPEAWRGINLESVEPIGFSSSHLLQILREFEKNPSFALSPETIQDSIDAMAFDLKYNNAEKDFRKPPATVLLTLLKQGRPYTSKTPDKFISPTEEALKRYNEMKLMQQAQELKLLQEVKENEFLVWQENLPEEELLSLCLPHEIPVDSSNKLFKTIRKRMAKEKSREYFDAEVWPKRKQEILLVGKQDLNQSIQGTEQN